ncbi:Coenzyme F420 hydrogenase/dehydrogenase, beta subunit C-terminal domain [Biformimicrobium ophioploci]|uniref:Coenzyme F420 hydrogenase/dehydrogenase, beta subunit C-terminal domain n=1 Tax=Biformimicrobium ophioploci TaxID=3036711 RepID=A0ABQ6M084_9GAMM|nr:Coenzyme F420 hydrogenase/dehydrogenase, beta subunit C-terminal domain [Microbulbifer sp. NKW57]GMG87749.1 Coenzyme F420 hydrogenase/dehydrogenase, beta subunit C-terminal domain [Microbulbifer sp. NKW57]
MHLFKNIRSIEDVRQSHLCTGCGICAALEPERYQIQDFDDEGLRPVVLPGAPEANGKALAACPGFRLDRRTLIASDRCDPDLLPDWGPVERVAEAYAADPTMRFEGSSGGAATAIASYCLQQAGMLAVLHTAADPHKPYANQSRVSEDASTLRSSAGSRYAPSAPCAKLTELGKHGKGVFIGKPCDVAAIYRAGLQDQRLQDSIGVTISIFCAGVPSTAGALALAHESGAPSSHSIKALRFRGKGWPGNWKLDYVDTGGSAQSHSMSYQESWEYLQRYRQWRCYICPDHTGEFSDISVGDPWYRPIKPGEAGSSLVIARTERGAEILEGAIRAGFLKVTREDKAMLPDSQPNLLKTRGALWGRLVTLRVLGAAAPVYHGFHLVGAFFRYCTPGEKISSILGTVKRFVRKRLYQPAGSIISKPEPATQAQDEAGVS